MTKSEIYKVIDELRKKYTSDMLIQDRILNYVEANIDEFIECYENDGEFEEGEEEPCPDCGNMNCYRSCTGMQEG